MWQNIIVLTIVMLSGLANLFLAVYVYNKNPKERVNKTFFYFGFTLFLWCIANFVSLLAKDVFWLRATYAIGPITLLSGVFFTYALSDKKIKKWFGISLSTICGILFVINVFTPFLIKNLISFTNFGFVIIPGPLFPLFGLFLLFMLVIFFYSPLSVIRKVNDQRKKQIIYFLTGSVIVGGCLALVTVILPALGVTQFTNLDSPTTIFLVAFTSYAIIKYNLMGIKSLLFKAFIYSLVVILIITVLLLLMFAGSYLFAHLMIWPIYIIAVLVAIMLFFIGRLFFDKIRDLEISQISLTESLEQSESNRMRAETERDKTSTIIRSFSDGLIIFDEKDEIFSINPSAEKILGLESIVSFKESIHFLANFPKAIPIISILNKGFNNITKKEVNLDKDLIIELSVIPLNLGENNIGHLAVLHDVSREKMIEKMKTDFISLAAHQLRTPLTKTSWSLGMLKKGDLGKLTAAQSKIIETTFYSNERMISLVNNLLDVTRIEEGKYLFDVTMTDVSEVVNFAINSYKYEINNNKIKIEFKEPSNLPQTMIDKEKLKLAVENFIDNAIRYSNIGGKIIITLENDNENIIFKIQDFGIGIPKNQQKNILKRFYRAENARKFEPNGTGLGLFLTQNIINAHNGKVWFESEEGAGSSFYFSLPIVNS